MNKMAIQADVYNRAFEVDESPIPAVRPVAVLFERSDYTDGLMRLLMRSNAVAPVHFFFCAI